MSDFQNDLAVIGAGRIGLPWAALIAVTQQRCVTCIDVDEDRVRQINDGISPFEEPELPGYLESAIEDNLIRATTDPQSLSSHEYVAITVNAQRHDMAGFVDVLNTYLDLLTDGQTVILRSTLPVDMVGRSKSLINGADADLKFVVFPERLAEGKAIEEIQTLPKVVGLENERSEAAIRDLLEPLGCQILVTDPETAMLVKLIDNSYRDALFAIANQIAFTSDQLGLNAHEATELANHDYPRNDIPTPGTVGGKCLPKDPHFLTDERVCDQPTTPDLFNATRRTNAYLPSYIVTELLRHQPTRLGVLGLSYKRGVGDVFNSPAVAILESLESQGVEVDAFDPYVSGYADKIDDAIRGADGVLLAVNHPEFSGIEDILNNFLDSDSFVYDIWGMLDPDQLTIPYSGFGINRNDR